MDLGPETEPIDVLEAKLGIWSENRPIDSGGDAKLGDKRPIDSGGDVELTVGLTKRGRCGMGEMKRVAEIVMVLSAMVQMRGGRTPTAAEADMMAEARAKVAALCQMLAPKDLVEKEAIGAVIEDLGINSKAKDHKLGFRPPRMSIADKFLLAKRRMEESNEFATHSGTYSSNRLQTGVGAAAEVRGTSHSISGFSLDKANNVPISSQHGPSTSLPYPTSEVRPSMVPGGLPGSHIIKNSSQLVMPRVDRANFRLDARARQVQDSPADRGLGNAPAWSLQPQSTSAAKSGPDNKVFKVDGNQSRVAPQTTRDQTPRPMLPHTTSVNMLAQQPLQAPSLSKNHNEIGKIVHKLLQPRLPEHPTWTPPSRDYMNKALNCQICQITINEVDNVLLCDACEKGFHLKCLEAYNQKGIPRVEWHCPKCLTLSNGKPLPPKYGRVMRNMNPLKAAPKISAAQSISEKKVGNLDQKVNEQTIPANGSSTFQSSPQTGTVSSSCVESGSIVNNSSSKEMQENNIPSSTNMNDKMMEADCISPVVSVSGKSVQEVQNLKSSSESEPMSVSKSVSPAKLADMVTNVSDSLASSKLQDDQTGELESAEKPVNELHDNNNMDIDSDNRKTINSTLRCDIKPNNHEVTQTGPNETTGGSPGTTEGAGVSANVELSVDWIGDALNIIDEKTFYSSFRINGVSYKVKDHALFHYSNDKWVPSKLKAMWEDSKTGSSWVIANICYFPEDLPEAVSRPCTPEINEVYESNNDSTVMASLIRGSCKVLPPEKYKEESENTLLGIEASDDGTPPVFLCRWLYDESKAVFQPAST